MSKKLMILKEKNVSNFYKTGLSEIGSIQLDLYNNALFFIEDDPKKINLDKLKASIKKRFNSQKVKDIHFIFTQKSPKSKNYFYEFKQINLDFFIREEFSDTYQKRLMNFLKVNNQNKNKVQVSLLKKIVPDRIDTLQYRGNKTQVLDFLLPHFKGTGSILDLMAGSQSVSLGLKSQVRIISNDVQCYSYVIGKAYIENNRYTRLKIIPKNLIKSNPSFNVFQNFYSDKYFTHKQSKEIDDIRATIEKIKKYDEILYFCYLSCLLRCLDVVARTAGHFDGAINKIAQKAINRKEKSIFKEFTKKIREFKTVESKFDHKCYNLPAKQLLEKINKIDIIYIDPPYNHRQYSRYYHILETCAKYDTNINKATKGYYRNDEFKSDFCYKEKVENAFKDIIELCFKKAKKKILISYSNIGLIDSIKLLKICEEFDPKAELHEKSIQYTRQKTSLCNNNEKELIYVLHT